jgi:hypothetical protein
LASAGQIGCSFLALVDQTGRNQFSHDAGHGHQGKAKHLRDLSAGEPFALLNFAQHAGTIALPEPAMAK